MSPSRPRARGFGAMEFVVRVLVQIPAPRSHSVRYYGFYSNAARGKLAGRALLPRGGARGGNDAAKGRTARPSRAFGGDDPAGVRSRPPRVSPSAHTRMRPERGEKCRRGSVPMPLRGGWGRSPLPPTMPPLAARPAGPALGAQLGRSAGCGQSALRGPEKARSYQSTSGVGAASHSEEAPCLFLETS
jgi:hypothetical protein